MNNWLIIDLSKLKEQILFKIRHGNSSQVLNNEDDKYLGFRFLRYLHSTQKMYYDSSTERYISTLNPNALYTHGLNMPTVQTVYNRFILPELWKLMMNFSYNSFLLSIYLVKEGLNLNVLCFDDI